MAATSACASSAATPLQATTSPPEAENPATEQPAAQATLTPQAGGGLHEVVVPEQVPTLDATRHSVPLERIYFDTFQPVNRAVPLTEASPALIGRLLDAIPPLHDPTYEIGSQVDWLRPEDMILGYASVEGAYAYPVRLLNYHEIVNDILGGEPVLISYCPLCYSGIVYSRQVDGQLLTFGNTSALYESDMVMVDYETGSYWWQVAGRGIVGPLTDHTLTVLPSQMATWETWQELHPDTLVLSRDTGFARDYSRDPFGDFAGYLNTGQFPFPVSRAGRDPRLQPGARVLAVQAGEAVRAYVLDAEVPAIIADQVGEQEVVVFIDPSGPQGAAFDPRADDRLLDFELVEGAFRDRQTGSEWDLAGRAIAGPLKGMQLTPLPSKTTFWFAIVAAEPQVTIYGR